MDVYCSKGKSTPNAADRRTKSLRYAKNSKISFSPWCSSAKVCFSFKEAKAFLRFSSLFISLPMSAGLTCFNLAINSLMGPCFSKRRTGDLQPLTWRIRVGSAVIGRLRFGKISRPTIALMVVDLPAFIVPTTAKTISRFLVLVLLSSKMSSFV